MKSGDVNAAIGSNIFGAILDEVNFMARVAQSKSADGGLFDQAVELDEYASLAEEGSVEALIKARGTLIAAILSSRNQPLCAAPRPGGSEPPIDSGSAC